MDLSTCRAISRMKLKRLLEQVLLLISICLGILYTIEAVVSMETAAVDATKSGGLSDPVGLDRKAAPFIRER